MLKRLSKQTVAPVLANIERPTAELFLSAGSLVCNSGDSLSPRGTRDGRIQNGGGIVFCNVHWQTRIVKVQVGEILQLELVNQLKLLLKLKFCSTQ
ncbi:hypothetical protein WA026_009948 [Henosepilachna vigintioctopunctata]|uniref:Uncharacterized protein n=1 Tax=Henosepilachna vigintioctopunctata TaxID=420089 RepID=A0AAW1TQQ2_9CUCU